MKKPIILGVVILISLVVNAQKFENLNFETYCKNLDENSCNWIKSWGADDCCSIKTENENSFLVISGKSENSVGFIEQEVEISVHDLVILEITGSIRTYEVFGKGAGLNLGVYDHNKQLIATKDMGGFYSQSWVRKNTDWNIYQRSIILPKETKSVKIGAILYGKGEASFDNFIVKIHSLENRKPNDLALTFISEAIEIIKKNSLFRDSLDIAGMQLNALKIAGIAEKPADCYLAIEYLLETLRPHGDNHSFFMSSAEAVSWKENSLPSDNFNFPEVKTIEDVGYVLVPGFHGGNEELMVAFATRLQKDINKVFNPNLKGWIVDLRQNTGGNMEPMITGLGPLLDTGNIGSLIDIDGNREFWQYRNGTYYWEKEAGITVENPCILSQQLPIVVLIGPQTGSSGEIIAISFIGNTKTITMGAATWGLTTGNGEFDLPDGAKMFLASTKMMDRNGNIYTAKIEPDILIEAPKMNSDVLVNFAIDWIKRQK